MYNVVANKPCDKKNKVFDDNDNTTERRELGNLTNVEAADVMKKKDAGKKLIEHGGTVSAAETPDEKKNVIDNIFENDNTKISIKRYSFDIRT